ncbi:MAG TPA: hypothetical protein DIS54_02025 [Candidatus Veblenbacteria bacterium]|nr:hypothetical protein [Candidatus Veblenbacteria bacterium]
MHKFNRKLLGKLNIATALFLAVLMTGGLLGANYVLAANTATQQASTAAATTISVVRKAVDAAIATIYFPEGSPGATVSAPYNDVDTSSDPQVLSATVSEPVVRLKNGSGGTLNVTLQITTWNATDALVASEDYELETTGTATINVVNDVLSADGGAASVDTTTTIAAGVFADLYLELVLGAAAGKTGNSTLTVLGES